MYSNRDLKCYAVDDIRKERSSLSPKVPLPPFCDNLVLLQLLFVDLRILIPRAARDGEKISCVSLYYDFEFQSERVSHGSTN